MLTFINLNQLFMKKLQPLYRLTIIFVLFVSTIIFSAPAKAQEIPCSANWWARCCKCDKECVVVTPRPAFGYCRHCNLLCKNCRKELGDLNAALEKLRGKNRGLKEAYDAFEKDYAEALENYNKARESVYGKEGDLLGGDPTLSGLSGSFGKFSGAGFAVLGNAGGATNTFKTVANGISIYQTSGPGDAVMNFSGAAADVFSSSEYAKKLTETILRKEMLDFYIDQLKIGSPVDFARANYIKKVNSIPGNIEDLRKGADFMGVLLDIWGYYTATRDLFKDITDIKENYTNKNIAKKEMDKISDSIVKNVELMTCIKETLDSLSKGRFTSIESKNFLYAFTAKMLLPALLKKHAANLYYTIPDRFIIKVNLVDSIWQLDELKLKSALSQLEQLMTLELRMVNRIENEIIPYLIPWIANRWKELKPAVLLKMLQKAHASLKILVSDLEKAKPLFEKIRGDVATLFIGYEIDFMAASSNSTGNLSPGAIGLSGKDKWKIAENKNIKGELGRVNMAFPKGIEWSIDIYTTEKTFLRNISGFGTTTFYDLVPGNYTLTMYSIPIENVPVEKGKATKLRVGFINFASPGHWEIHDESNENTYTTHNMAKTIAIPVGTYQVRFADKFYRVIIKEGQTIKFEKPLGDIY